MSKDIAVSVCCITYNHEKYIRKCLESIISQETSFDFEIVIHDDASSDFTVEIIKEYKQRFGDKIKLYTEKENQYSKGKKALADMTFKYASGKYIALCEGDDFWCDNTKLQRQYDAMERNNASWCVHSVQCVQENSDPIQDLVIPKSAEEIGQKYENIYGADKILKMFINDGFQMSSYFINRYILREYYDNTPEFVRISPTEDEALVRFLAVKGDTIFLNTTMSCYRMNSVGSWTTTSIKSDEKMANQFANLQAMLKAFDLFTEQRFSKILYDDIIKKEWMEHIYRKKYRKLFSKKYMVYRRKWSTKTWVKMLIKAIVCT